MGVLDDRLNTNRVAFNYARALQYFRSPDPALSFAGQVIPVVENFVRFIPYAAANDVPAHIIVISQNYTYIFIDGMTTIRQMEKVAEGYIGSIYDSRRNPVNAFFRSCAEAIVDHAADQGAWYGNFVTVAGYSMGGAIASLMPFVRTARRQNEPTCRVITFGAPRPGDSVDMRRVTESCEIARYMTDNDPVPLTPFRSGESIAFSLVVGSWAQERFDNFCHPGNGLSIDERGELQYKTTPPLAATQPALSFASWLTDHVLNNPTSHSLDVYQFRLQLQSVTPPAITNHTRVPAEPSEDTSGRDLSAQERNLGVIITAHDRQQTSVPLSVPSSAVFFSKKKGAIWYIYFGDKPVASTAVKRKAKALCRDMNSFLRRLQTAGLVEPSALLNQLELYLQAASDPSGGFSPVMSISF